MKKIIALILVCAFCALAFVSCADAEKTKTEAPKTEETSEPTAPETKPEPAKAAFEGTMDDILNMVVAKAIELDEDKEFGISSIECTNTPVTNELCDLILGLTEEEFAALVDEAIESKPNGSWFTHSVVVVKLKDGVNVEEAANKIVANTSPSRFGCLKPQSIVGSYAGNFVVFAASSETTTEAVFGAVKALSGIEPTRIDRENTWSSQGGLIGCGN